MRKLSLLLIGVLSLLGSNGKTNRHSSTESTDSVLDQNKKEVSVATSQMSSSITIYYGLNESHSKSWAQIAKNGVVGVLYFQRLEGSLDEGTLIYQSIRPDGTKTNETVTTGRRLEISVLLYDSLSTPHIFLARSDNTDQIIDHFSRTSGGQWQSETVIHFRNEGGRYIYELSADTGPDQSFHLLVLKTQSNLDTMEGFDAACFNNHLYHITDASGIWRKELIHIYNMVYTYDMCIKQLTRQDMKVDKEGHVHVVFGEQRNSEDYEHSSSRLCYTTNKTGNWVIETASNYDNGTRDDAGWFPSLCLNSEGIPYVSCMYVKRVSTGSASYCRLLLLQRIGHNDWQKETIAEYDDGYHGSDGRHYTGALSHLVIDNKNRVHIVFSDVASSHWAYQNGNIGNVLNVGNIRYGILNNGTWNISTIYRQPLPTSFVNATEMHGMCLLVADTGDSLRVIGQELISTGWDHYTCRLVHVAWKGVSATPPIRPDRYRLNQNYPNPCSSATLISYSLPRAGFVSLKVRDILGREVRTLVMEYKETGSYVVCFDASRYANGVYFYTMQAGKESTETKKMAIVR